MDFKKMKCFFMKSYLTKRQQPVRVYSKFSTWERIINEDPQDSIIDPLNIFLVDLFLRKLRFK